jgi:hypothetical protein
MLKLLSILEKKYCHENGMVGYGTEKFMNQVAIALSKSPLNHLFDRARRKQIAHFV